LYSRATTFLEAMAALQLSVEAQLQQLGEARNIVLKDPGYWPQVLERTLPIITGPILEVRRWGADFLAETFSTPIVDARAKQELASACLDTVLRLSNETEISILKGVVQCSASVYPMIFRHMYVLPVTIITILR
jgi:symplekin